MDSLGTSVYVVSLWTQELPMLYRIHLPNNSWKDKLNSAKLPGTSSQYLLQMPAPKNYCCILKMKPPLDRREGKKRTRARAHTHTHTHTHTVLLNTILYSSTLLVQTWTGLLYTTSVNLRHINTPGNSLLTVLCPRLYKYNARTALQTFMKHGTRKLY
jgi:hypothetical protein